MTDYLVPPSLTATLTLTGTDTLWIEPVGSIVVSGADAVIWDLAGAAAPPPGVVIFNEGLIQPTTARAIDTSGSAGGVRSIFLTNLGTIASLDDAFRIDDGLTDGVVSLVNYGTIEATGSGQGLDFNAVEFAASVTITNYAGGVIRAANNDAIRPGANATIDNFGWIIADSSGGDSSDGINFDTNGGVTVNNNLDDSLIFGARHGITGEGLDPVTINNWGFITGGLGSGINMDTGPIVTTIVTNHGTITGNAAGDQDGDGIDTDGLLELDNYGLVQGLGVWSGGLSEAITVGGGIINNHAGGKIYSVQRAINVDDSEGGDAPAGVAIDNEGTIEGGNGQAIVIVGAFADILINKGTILGSVMMGDGLDAIELHTGSTISALLDGEGGLDIMTLVGSGNGMLGSVVNVDELDVEGGSWTIATDQAYDVGVSILAGAALTLGEGGTSGSLQADVSVNGLLAIDRSDTLTFGGMISGGGKFEQRGTGTTILNQANTYSGGTKITHGTLDLAALGAAGTGAITFGDGAQTLKIENAALSANAFGNTIVNFGAGDVIDLTGLAFAAGATVTYDAGTDLLSVFSGGVTVTLTLADPVGTDFAVASDGGAGTSILLMDGGVSIGGTKHDDVIDASQTVFGEDVPTGLADVIRGRGGDDRIAGLDGNDSLHGDEGDDELNGGRGDDLLSGGLDKNRLTGGEGLDAFLFNSELGKGKDAKPSSDFSFSKITDFAVGEDLIELGQSVFQALALGPLSPSEFALGSKAKDADDHILYKQSTGALYYDKDGAGGAKAVQFAKLTTKPAIDADDFLVVA